MSPPVISREEIRVFLQILVTQEEKGSLCGLDKHTSLAWSQLAVGLYRDSILFSWQGYSIYLMMNEIQYECRGLAASVTKDSGIQDPLFSTVSTNDLRNG